ncbi:MAG: hypothetical protein CML66_22320 [Rhodobacteraceae bacterium]|nr:hypothetical protein [Paracoccaceae bacterium]MAY48027.1 hypothetical protein [Paracoccaceae bacterium]
MTEPDGYRTYAANPGTRCWAAAALAAARPVLRDPEVRARNLRHGGTWFVGVDELPSGAWGAIGDVPLRGAFLTDLCPVKASVQGQLSVVYPGYPGRDPDESVASHRYRLMRAAAHVDGLKAVGPARRRVPDELHAFILGLPLSDVTQAPTLVWPGSHRIIGAALLDAVGDADPIGVDVSEAYGAARAEVFRTIRPVAMPCRAGEAFLLHRFLLHGTAPWEDDLAPAPEGRVVAFFRPEVATLEQWRTRTWA